MVLCAYLKFHEAKRDYLNTTRVLVVLKYGGLVDRATLPTRQWIVESVNTRRRDLPPDWQKNGSTAETYDEHQEKTDPQHIRKIFST